MSEMDPAKSVIATLVLMRRARGMTQQQLASAAGLARESVSKLETQAVDPQLSTLEAYAWALDLEFLVVPRALRVELERFILSGGRYLAQPTGVGAPRSIVDDILERPGPGEPSGAPWGSEDESDGSL